MSECKCNLRTRLVGDGCQYCNPTMHAEVLSQRCEDLEAEIARLRLTDEEREAVDGVAAFLFGLSDICVQAGTCQTLRDRAATLRKLLERLGGER